MEKDPREQPDDRDAQRIPNEETDRLDADVERLEDAEAGEGAEDLEVDDEDVDDDDLEAV